MEQQDLSWFTDERDLILSLDFFGGALYKQSEIRLGFHHRYNQSPTLGIIATKITRII